MSGSGKNVNVGRAGDVDLHAKATRALQRLPGVVRSFFADPDLRYIHT